jgi:hypothetical protein
MRGADSRIIEAIIGALLAAALLLAAFAVIAQEPESIGRLIVRLPDWADAPAARAMSSERARALSVIVRTPVAPPCRMSSDAHVVAFQPRAATRAAVRHVLRRRDARGARCTARA